VTDTFDLRSGVLEIVFDDGRFAGAEVVVRTNAPYRVRREVNRVIGEYGDAPSGSDAEALAIDALYDVIVEELVVRWNLSADGVALPVSRETLQLADADFAWTLVRTWRNNLGAVMPPLPSSSPSTASDSSDTEQPSPDGETSPATPTTPEPLSMP
jgi:hypothetical protein